MHVRSDPIKKVPVGYPPSPIPAPRNTITSMSSSFNFDGAICLLIVTYKCLGSDLFTSHWIHLMQFYILLKYQLIRYVYRVRYRIRPSQKRIRFFLMLFHFTYTFDCVALQIWMLLPHPCFLG